MIIPLVEIHRPPDSALPEKIPRGIQEDLANLTRLLLPCIPFPGPHRPLGYLRRLRHEPLEHQARCLRREAPATLRRPLRRGRPQAQARCRPRRWRYQPRPDRPLLHRTLRLQLRLHHHPRNRRQPSHHPGSATASLRRNGFPGNLHHLPYVHSQLHARPSHTFLQSSHHSRPVHVHALLQEWRPSSRTYP